MNYVEFLDVQLLGSTSRFLRFPFAKEHLKAMSPKSPIPVSTVGVWPNWPETLAMARRRFAERLLVYISRGAKARRTVAIPPLIPFDSPLRSLRFCFGCILFHILETISARRIFRIRYSSFCCEPLADMHAWRAQCARLK